MASLALPARALRLCAQRPVSALRSRAAPLSSTALRRNATPDWEQLIGGRAGVERRRAEFQDRYRAALEAKAKQEGTTVEELKRRAAEESSRAPRAQDVMSGRRASPAPSATGRDESLGPVEAGSLDTRKTAGQLDEEGQAAEVVKPLPSAQQGGEADATAQKPQQPLAPKKRSDSPVKVRPLTTRSLTRTSPDR